MNTRGHESIAKDAGLPVLEQAFKTAGKEIPDLSAFYMGNWLTDVSQVIDPVAYKGFVKGVMSFIDYVLHLIKSSFFFSQGQIFFPERINSLEINVFEARNRLKIGLNIFTLGSSVLPVPTTRNGIFGDCPEKAPPKSEAAEFMTTCMRIKGYFKFVYKTNPNEKTMDEDVFFRIFNCRFTQYYPHEHLDRPQVLPPKDPTEYISKKSNGPRSGTENIRPDLYEYLRDDIEIVASIFSNIDLMWASKTFQPVYKVNDKRIEWNLSLATLGHAMHAIEDFFAHSNFTEHACMILGKDFVLDKLPKREKGIFLKRLRSYSPNLQSDWRKNPEENYVVTGYFDTKDTLVSICHLIEHITGYDEKSPLASLLEFRHEFEEMKKPVYKCQKYLRDTLEFLVDPTSATKDKENKVAKKFADIKKDIDKDLDYINGIFSARRAISIRTCEKLFAEFPFFKNVNTSIKRDIINYVVFMNSTYKFGKDLKKFVVLYKAVKDVMEFIANPVAWILSLISKELLKLVKRTLIFITKELAYDIILGQQRIGCHSLLAKDNGAEVVYAHAKNCAMAVHSYILTVLCRWADPEWLKGSELPDQRWVNWLELIEYFLRHPSTGVNYEAQNMSIEVDGTHQFRNERIKSYSLEFLAGRYLRVSSFTNKYLFWEAITDANFDISSALREIGILPDMITREHRESLVSKILNNEIWTLVAKSKEGVKFIVPALKLEVTVGLLDPSVKIWWAEVLRRKDWRVFQGFRDLRSQTSLFPIESHKIKYCRDVEEFKSMMFRGMKLLNVAENSYRI